MIVKKIHQVVKTIDLLPSEIESKENIIKKNPGYHYTLWTDETLEKLAMKNHKGLYDSWKTLKGIQKSDLGRYLVLYVHGGFYCDTDFYLNKGFETLEIRQGNIYFSPSTPNLPWMDEGITNYFIYTEPGEQFFLDLIDEALKRISTYVHRDPSYISSTSGKILIEYVMKNKKYNIHSFKNKIVNMYCSHTDTTDSIGYHVGGNAKSDKSRTWLNGNVVGLIGAECYLRRKMGVQGNICQLPIIIILIFLLALIMIYWRKTIFKKTLILKNGIINSWKIGKIG